MQVAITGIIRFATLDVPEAHPNFPDQDPKFRLQFNTPKENAEIRQLLQTVQQVGKSAWGTGDEAKQRFRGVMRTIEEGDNEGSIGLLDGDAFKPEYNTGQYVLKASAKQKERPRFRDADGKQTNESPKPGDLVRVLLDVWAMPQHKRINFTIQGIRMIEPSFAEIGPPQVTDEMVDEALEAGPSEEVLGLFDGTPVPALPEGESEVEVKVEEEPKPKRKRGRPRKKKVEEEDIPPASEGDEGTSLFDGL